MSPRAFLLLGALVLPGAAPAQTGGVLPDSEPPAGVTQEPDSSADRMSCMLRRIGRRGDSGGPSLPFGLDRLLRFSRLFEDLELPGGVRVDFGLDGVGIGIEF